jgi:hypothetical protein
LARESASSGETDTAAAARDERDFALHVWIDRYSANPIAMAMCHESSMAKRHRI